MLSVVPGGNVGRFHQRHQQQPNVLAVPRNHAGHSTRPEWRALHEGIRFPRTNQVLREPRLPIYSEEHQRRAALALAATWVEGDERDRLLEQAMAPRGTRRNSKKEREIENLRMWAIDPTNLRLRECGPSTILKNIFSLENLSNPAAEVFYMMLAFWRYCPADRKEPVLHYFEQAAKHAMNSRRRVGN